MVKKLVRLVLVMAYLLAVSGVSIVRHYCADELASISLNSDSGCGSCSDTEDDCCSTEVTQSEVNHDHSPATSVCFSPWFQVLKSVLPPSYSLWLVQKAERVTHFWERGPPLYKNLHHFLSWVANWRN